MKNIMLLYRHGGMGDVLMALAACKAVKTQYSCELWFMTAAEHLGLALACPWVDCAFSPEEILKDHVGEFNRIKDEGNYFDLNLAIFGTGGIHQVDAYLKAIGTVAPPEQKELELQVPMPLVHLHRAVVIHPACGDPNRTWTEQNWNALADLLWSDGFRVILVGSEPKDGKGAYHLNPHKIAVDWIGQKSPLETIHLMKMADCLVSTDSGPIQLAGATDIGIVGLYSVVRGNNRLPYRHGEAGWNAIALEPACSVHPCFPFMNTYEGTLLYNKMIREQGIKMQDVYGVWCPHDLMPYHCMELSTTPEDVFKAVKTIFKEAL